jgi:arylsulfatase A-like enzyme
MIAKWFSLYDQAARTPLALRVPGGTLRGVTLDQNVEMVDLAPTLLELVGVAPWPDPDLERWKIPHSPMSGTSFAPLLTDPEAPHKDVVYSMNENGLMVRTDHYKLVVYAERGCFNYPDDLFRGIDGAGELYDLRMDPGEHRNLFSDPGYEAEKAGLSVRLLQHLIRDHHWLGKHGSSAH